MSTKIESYKYDICGRVYSTEKQAKDCEARKTEVPEFKEGDRVRILSGDGKGEVAKIARIFFYEPSWGGERYAHKVGYSADLINSWGSRQLIQGVDMERA